MLSAAKHAQIKQIIIDHSGMLSVAFLPSLLSELECTIDQLMLALLPLASEFAVMPVCGFMVGAVALGETGNVYVGASQDLGNIALSQAVHAEQCAIAIAHQHGETNVVKIAINASPCGHCRQFLFELVGGGDLEILVNGEPPVSLSTLLPRAFGPHDLGIEGGLLSPQQHALHLISHQDDSLAQAAMQVAVRSYAPYTKCYSGAVLKTRDGRLFSGSYLENVAFNPSLPAIQAAFSTLIMSGCRYDDVVEAAFVQVKENAVDQEAAAHMLLRALCPLVHLQVAELAIN